MSIMRVNIRRRFELNSLREDKHHCRAVMMRRNCYLRAIINNKFRKDSASRWLIFRNNWKHTYYTGGYQDEHIR